LLIPYELWKGVIVLKDMNSKERRDQKRMERRYYKAVHGRVPSAYDQYDSIMTSHKLLSAVEEVALAKKVEQGDQKARDRLVLCNLRLVIMIARRYDSATSLDISDLWNIGNIGLIAAIDRFDWRKGWKFSTYATWWIRQAIIRGIANESSLIRQPVHNYERIRRLAKLTNDFEFELTEEEISQQLKISLETVQTLMKSLKLRTVFSLDRSSDEVPGTVFDGPDPTIDLVQDYDAIDPAEDLSSSEDRIMLFELLAFLPERERQVIIWRFGLDDSGNALTLEEVADKINLTRERIRQIEVKALKKLRAEARKSSKIREYFNPTISQPR
jgi:RNA polymerase primary sigma factor